jgi:methylated-DNA-protein-cysteine methyltransferase-like protein
MSLQNPFDRVYDIVKKIPPGKVMTYKQVSILANVATPRIVGFAMAGNKHTDIVPCHRVIKSDGTLAGYGFGGPDIKEKKLKKEGVVFIKKGLVDLSASLYQPR